MKQSKNIIAERREIILNYLKKHGKACVEELSEICGVSALTVRRDLDALETLGTVKRYFGGAEFVTREGKMESFEEKSVAHFTEKQMLAEKASEFIKDGSTVFMNSGTTMQQVLGCIQSRNVTVITNNALAFEYSGKIDGRIICTGGVYTDVSKAYIGAFATDIIRRTYADVCILGVNGISTASGLTTSELQETIVNQEMANRCQGKVIVVADGSKVGRTYSFVSLELSHVNMLITDSSADREEVEKLRALGLEVLVYDVERNMQLG